MPIDRLTIVVVCDFAHVNGGGAQVALASACELARRGHSVFLFAAVGPIDPRLSQAGVHVICTNQHEILNNPNRIAAAIQGIWNSKAASAMEVLLRPLDARQTIVHIHGWVKAISSSIIPVILRHGARFVVTIHDYATACPNGGFFNYVSGQSCHLKPLSAACITTNCDSRNYAQKLWRVARHYAQIGPGRFPKDVCHFISISEFSRSLIERHLPSKARLYNIGNPIDIEQLPSPRLSSRFPFVVVGRLSLDKGPLIAAEAARRAGQELKFIGDGFLKSEIESKYPEFKITGWMSREGVQQELAGARALVFPSLWYEVQPLVVLEAAALGIPAVVADTSAARDSVIDGETGLWFRGGDVEDLAQKLRRLEDSDLVVRLGQAAHEHFWSSPPLLSRHADELEKCYELILGHHNPVRLLKRPTNLAAILHAPKGQKIPLDALNRKESEF